MAIEACGVPWRETLVLAAGQAAYIERVNQIPGFTKIGPDFYMKSDNLTGYIEQLNSGNFEPDPRMMFPNANIVQFTTTTDSVFPLGQDKSPLDELQSWVKDWLNI